MGVWGIRLYSGDFAMDLRSTISAVARLPFDSEKLVDILCSTEPRVAKNPEDEDHTTFWLVLADQFAKRGILSDRVREKALTIIDSDSDIAMHAKLGMTTSDLEKRRKVLADLRSRLATLPNGKPRTVLKKPQTYVMEVGDVLVYPTCYGKCINPYFASKELNRVSGKSGPEPWQQNGWAAMVIVQRGRAFDFLTWYQPLTLSTAFDEKPTLSVLQAEVLLWKLPQPGTCSPIHFKRMELEKIASLAIDDQKLKRAFPDMPPGVRYAINDISIANRLNVAPHSPSDLTSKPGGSVHAKLGRPDPTISGIQQILSA